MNLGRRLPLLCSPHNAGLVVGHLTNQPPYPMINDADSKTKGIFVTAAHMSTISTCLIIYLFYFRFIQEFFPALLGKKVGQMRLEPVNPRLVMCTRSAPTPLDIPS